MILKKIEIYGFKSFGKKIEIDLNDNITCVVGPNGSGKSNIIDALRWVMGEQRVKSLRGSKMNDIIFSGTNEKKPLGYAQVCVTLDNSSGIFASDYDELSVMRRLFRSGESEYYINKNLCRLKDVQQLFMDTGLGREGYSLIGQGQIERLVTESPEDRKLLIEEAAGVVKYKYKKNEAERKLERAQNNLYRITDIIAELEGRVPVLKRQSEKAEKYVALRNRLKEIEIGIFVRRMDMLTSQNDGLGRDRAALSESLRDMDGQIEENDRRYRFLKATVGTFDERISAANSAIYKLSDDYENAKINIQVAKTNLKNLEGSLADTGSEYTQYDDEIKKLNGKKDELTAELDRYKKELGIISAQYGEYKDNVEKVLSRLREEESQLRLLEGYENSMQGYQYAIRELIKLKKDRPDAVAGLHTTVGEIIEAAPKYAKAVSVALGGAVSYMVCDDEKTASSCINILKSSKWGRVTFLPMNIIKPAFRPDDAAAAKACSGFVAFADELTQCAPQYRNIVSNLLGRIVICETLSDANKIAAKISYRLRIVTLSGEVIFPGGAMAGGQYKNEDEGSIARRNQIASLKEAVKKDKALYDRFMEQGTKDGDAQIIKLREEVIRCGENLKNNEEKSAYFLSLASNRRERTQRTEEEIAGLKADIAGYSDSDNGYEEKKKLLEENYHALIKEKESANKEYTEVNEKITSLYRDRNDVADRLSKVEVVIGRTEVEIDHLQNDMMEDYSLTYAAAIPLKTDIADLDKSVAEAGEIREKIRRLGNINVDALEEYKQLKERYDSMCTQRDDLVQSRTDLLKIIDDISAGMEAKFNERFAVIQREFNDVFQALFNGGEATLVLTDPGDVMASGIDIIARPPNTRLKNITALSGGEKSLTAIALIFAILRIKPSPFCVLDEIDAALDDANVARFGEFLNRVSQNNQFIVVTHKKKTMESAGSLYGVSMGSDGLTKVISVKLSDIETDEKGEYELG